MYSEGYGSVMLWEDEDGRPILRHVQNVRLLDKFDVDTSIRPVVDSEPGQLNRRVWKFDTYFHKRLDKPLVP